MTDERPRVANFARMIAALEALTALDAAKFQNKPLVEALFAELRELTARIRTAEQTHDLLALNRLMAEALEAMVRFAALQSILDA